jgi:hypothetical protein
MYMLQYTVAHLNVIKYVSRYQNTLYVYYIQRLRVLSREFCYIRGNQEGQDTDGLVADKYESIKYINENNNGTADRTSLFLTTTGPKTDYVTSPQE